MVATSSQTCKVVVESSSRSILNLLNFGANKGNVSDPSDYINNKVHKLTRIGEIPQETRPNKVSIREMMIRKRKRPHYLLWLMRSFVLSLVLSTKGSFNLYCVSRRRSVELSPNNHLNNLYYTSPLREV